MEPVPTMSPFDIDHDATWKKQTRERIMNNLNTLLQEAFMTHKAKMAKAIFAAPEIRHQFEEEYQQEIRHLKQLAEQEIQVEIKRGEEERKWSKETSWDDPNDITQALIEEQISILKHIKSSPSSPIAANSHEYQKPFFHEATTSTPLSYDTPSLPQSPITDSFSSPASGFYSSFSPSPVSILSVESPADKEARLRAEKREKQQEEYRKRAEAIMSRKRLEKQWSHWGETMSSASSTTSASEDSDHPATPDIAIPMSDEDIANLMTFHEQQWTWIASLPHLEWTDFPWPVLSFSTPMRKEELTLEAVVQYIFAPLKARHDRNVVKDRLKELIMKWHPDRFETKYLALIVSLREREKVREGAGTVARILNDLLGKWNDL
ncbi:hypothetical protein CPC08DRAFT_290225 [Agrocybe pediades]|nr:hypothetical protein CPC08DRAFT_290225 [Agrocybe pediades]